MTLKINRQGTQGGSFTPTDTSILDEQKIGETPVGKAVVWSLIDAAQTTRTKLFQMVDSGVFIAAAGMTISAFTTAGVLHNNTSGQFSSSLIVNADITASTITAAKLAAGGANTVLWTDGSLATSWSGAPILSTSLTVQSGATKTVIANYTLGGAAAIFMGSAAPSQTNYILSSDGSNTYLNNPNVAHPIQFMIADVEQAQIDTFGLRFPAPNTFFATTAKVVGYGNPNGDFANYDLTIRGMAPFATATGGNRTPGNVVIDIPDPTNGGTTYGFTKFSWNNVVKAQFGVNTSAGASAHLFLGSAAPILPGTGVGNYIVSSDGSTTTNFNAPSGGSIVFTVSNVAKWGINSTDLHATAIQAGLLAHQQKFEDTTAIFDFTFRSQAPFGTSSVNNNSGSLLFDIPAARPGGTSGTHKFQFATATAFSFDSATQMSLFGRTWTSGAGAPGGTPAEGALYTRSGTGVGDLLVGVNGAWVSTTAVSGVGTITGVVAGAGLTGGGSSGSVTLDVVAADGTIIVSANDIKVGTVPVAQLSAGSNGQILTVVTGVPTWVSASGSVTLAGDVTGPSSSNTIANLAVTKLALGAANTVLGSNGTINAFTGAPTLSTSLSIGTNPATVGAIRLANNTAISGRNAANSVDINLISTDSSDRVLIGASASAVRVSLLGAGVVHSDASGTLSSSTITNADLAGSIAVTKLLGGTDGQVLQTVTATPTWSTYAGDVTGKPTASTVVALTGSGGTVAMHGTTILSDAGLALTIHSGTSGGTDSNLTLQAGAASANATLALNVGTNTFIHIASGAIDLKNSLIDIIADSLFFNALSGTIRGNVTSGGWRLGDGTAATNRLEVVGDIKLFDTGSHTGKVTSNNQELILEQTGDSLGTTRLRMQARSGLTGAQLENASLDLVDLQFKGTIGAAHIRMENRVGNMRTGTGTATELQFGPPGTPTMVIGSARNIVWMTDIVSLPSFHEAPTSGGWLYERSGSLTHRGRSTHSTTMAGIGAPSFSNPTFKHIEYGHVATSTNATGLSIDLLALVGSAVTFSFTVTVKVTAFDTVFDLNTAIFWVDGGFHLASGGDALIVGAAHPPATGSSQIRLGTAFITTALSGGVYTVTCDSGSVGGTCDFFLEAEFLLCTF